MLPQLDPTLLIPAACALLTTLDLGQLPVSYFSGPALLLGVFLVHFYYYRKSLRTDGQQVIEIDDLTNLANLSHGQSVIRAENVEFCAIQGTASSCDLPEPVQSKVALLGPATKLRFADSVTIENRQVLHTLVCTEDLTTGGTTIFYSPVKVGGDLTILGKATFHQPVVVNGVLKVEGHAHFSRGLIAKGDALVTGDITIGTRECKSWAVLRSLNLASRLRLNGQLISSEDLAFPKAA